MPSLSPLSSLLSFLSAPSLTPHLPLPSPLSPPGRPYKPWEGEDCSWLWAYAAGHPSSRLGLGHAYLALVLGAALSSLLASQTQTKGQRGQGQGQGQHKAQGRCLDPDPLPAST